MRFGLTSQLVLGGVFALVATTSSGRSHACGGCFHEPEVVTPGQETKSTVIVAHRMAVSISTSQTVLWDQVQYAGEPSSFAWVLPVKAGARLELSTDAWFETLDAATTAQIESPVVQCAPFDNTGGVGGGVDYGYEDAYGYDEGTYSSGCSAGGCGKDGAGSGGDDGGEGGYGGTGGYDGCGGCGGAGGTGAVEPPPPPPVVVVHQATVGPYETVTLHANDPMALPGWLTDHGFVIDPGVQPIIDAYTSEGFDFIAMKLVPGQGVDRMKPVRVVMPGASPTLPLRMVAAGTGANVGITLFVISEGRYEAGNFPNGAVDRSMVSWDFDLSDSNYGTLRKDVLAQAEGRTWLTPYAKAGALFQPVVIFDYMTAEYDVGGYTASTIAEAYVRQAAKNGEVQSSACYGHIYAASNSNRRVVEACDPAPTGGSGGSGGVGGFGSGGAATGGANTGGSGGALGVPVCGATETDGRLFACDDADDLSSALVGLHPKSVWLTRLESNLPRAALADDLTLSAAGISPVDNGIVAASYTGDPCAGIGTPLSNKRPIRDLPSGRRSRRPAGSIKATISKGRSPSLAITLAVAALSLTAARRLARRRVTR